MFPIDGSLYPLLPPRSKINETMFKSTTKTTDRLSTHALRPVKIPLRSEGEMMTCRKNPQKREECAVGRAEVQEMSKEVLQMERN